MADNELKVVIGAETKGLEKGLKKAEKSFKELQEQIEAQSGVVRNLERELIGLNAELVKMTRSQNISARQYLTLKTSIKKTSQEFKTQKEVLESLRSEQVDVGGYEAQGASLRDVTGAIESAIFQLTGFRVGLQTTTSGIGKATGGLKGFKTALISTGIGAIVVLVGLLVSNWDKLVSVFTEAGRELKGLNAEFERLQGNLGTENARIALLGAQIALYKKRGATVGDSDAAEKAGLQEILAIQKEQERVLGRKLVNIKKTAKASTSGGGAVVIDDEEAKLIEEATQALLKKAEAIKKTELALLNVGQAGRDAETKLIKRLAQEKEAREKAWDQERAAAGVNDAKKLKAKEDYEAGSQRILEQSIEDEGAIQFKKDDEAIQALERGNLEKYRIQKLGSDDEKALHDTFIEDWKKTELTFSEWKKTRAGIDAQEAINIANDKYAGLTEAQINYQNGLEDLNEKIGQAMEGAIGTMASGLGRMVGELQSGKMAMSDAGKALLGLIGGVVAQIGQAAIVAGVAMLNLKAAFNTPLAAIAAGVAAVAVGNAMKAASSAANSIGSSSGGGVAGGGSSSGSSFVSGGSGNGSGNGGGTVVFEIAGTKLVGVLSNTLRRNRALGGQLQIST